MIKEFMASFLSMVQAPGMADPRAELLAKLHDVIPPAPIGAWPPAIGWWVLFLLIAAICTAATHLLITLIQKRKYRKAALHEISRIESDTDLSAQEKILHTLHVLKRTFFTAYPHSRATSAGIYGAQWIKLLNTSAGKTIFEEHVATALEAQLYAPSSDTIDTINFIASSKRWIRQHKVNSKPLRTSRLHSEEAHV